MINRYEIKEISDIWKEDSKFQYYLKVELEHLNTLKMKGLIQKKINDSFKNIKIDVNRINELEKSTHHDVIAFCTSITEQLPLEIGRFFHFGLTSSDVIDTAHALMLKDSMKIIEKDFIELKSALRQKAIETREILSIGRSHGISAEAMIFGQKFLSFEAELDRRLKEWTTAHNQLTGQMSGAVGNYTIVTPEMEEITLSNLGLNVETVSTQVIPRDHYARIISIGALIGSLLERIATELRLLQHSDIDEVREGFKNGQKGSSTMPHKKNPISSENITGLARLLRSHLTPMLENCVLWHERDISHSSVERMIFPDHFGILAYATRRMRDVIVNLVINQKRIESKVESNEKIYSSLVLHKLIEQNPIVPRENLYEIIQRSFFNSQNLRELTKNLTLELEINNLNHDLQSWLDFSTLKNHYKNQFKILIQRLK